MTYKHIALFFLSCVLFSCKKEVPIIPKAIINKKIDSILTIRIKELDENAHRDLEHRITIEVKVKADSIFHAKIQTTTIKDTLNKKVQK